MQYAICEEQRSLFEILDAVFVLVEEALAHVPHCVAFDAVLPCTSHVRC